MTKQSSEHCLGCLADPRAYPAQLVMCVNLCHQTSVWPLLSVTGFNQVTFCFRMQGTRQNISIDIMDLKSEKIFSLIFTFLLVDAFCPLLALLCWLVFPKAITFGPCVSG